MNAARVRELVDRLIEAKFKENSYYYDEPVRPKAHAPAGPLELAALDDFLVQRGLRMPHAYRLFLSTCNGIDALLGPSMSLFSAQEVARDDHGIIEEMAEEYPSCSQFIVGGGNTPDILAFDVATLDEERGYEVVWITGDASVTRWKNFEDFLVSHLAVLERNVANEQKDRENLPP